MSARSPECPAGANRRRPASDRSRPEDVPQRESTGLRRGRTARLRRAQRRVSARRPSLSSAPSPLVALSGLYTVRRQAPALPARVPGENEAEGKGHVPPLSMGPGPRSRGTSPQRPAAVITEFRQRLLAVRGSRPLCPPSGRDPRGHGARRRASRAPAGPGWSGASSGPAREAGPRKPSHTRTRSTKQSTVR